MKAGALFALLALSAASSADDELTKSTEWDVLIFTQHWPATVCHIWKNKNPSHTCTFPSQKEAWTVHGVWPTELGTMNPNFCNNTWKFDSSQLVTIESQMEQYWTNIEKDTPPDSFWNHEWMKHGTCAASHPALDNEKKYFAQGLRWLQLFSMTDILAKSGIFPNDSVSHDPMVVYNSIKDSLKINPSIHCSVDPHTGISYIFEIRICFDKNLNLTDCDGVLVEGDRPLRKKGKLIHCDLTKPVQYPSIVPPLMRSKEWELPLVEIYKLITWLRWFTL